MARSDTKTRPALGSRRAFLGQSAALAVSALALGCSRDAGVESAPATVGVELDTIRLGDDMLMVLGPDANSLAVDGRDGIILVDGGAAAWSGALLAHVRGALGDKPVSALFNTHWHPEQTGSNVALGKEGARIIAHENTRLWLETEVRVPWSGKQHPPLPLAGIPDTTFYDSGSMQVAERKIEYRYMLNAHTDGDICLLFPDENVLVTGGPVSNGGWPIIDWWTGGWIGGMLDGFDILLEIATEDTVIVPSRGPVMTRADLETQHEMYLTIFDRLQSMLTKSYGMDEVLAARPMAEFEAEWGDSELFVEQAFRSMLGHLRDAYDTRMRNIP